MTSLSGLFLGLNPTDLRHGRTQGQVWLNMEGVWGKTTTRRESSAHPGHPQTLHVPTESVLQQRLTATVRL